MFVARQMRHSFSKEKRPVGKLFCESDEQTGFQHHIRITGTFVAYVGEGGGELVRQCNL